MRTIVTFLGKRPILTHYSFKGQVIEGEVFAKALRCSIVYDRMLVFSTPEAHTTTWPVLESLGDPRIQEIPIAVGASREETWLLFDAVIQQIGENETVIFDITHGLRSIPFMAFLFAAYLKTAKNVHIEAIYYGAFELGDEKKGIPAPVIDLSEYAAMLDWITATDQFVNTGNAGRLASLLEDKKNSQSASTLASEELKHVSKAAFLCQPFTLAQQAGELRNALNLAAGDFSVTARPFNLLSDRIVEAFEAFSSPKSDDPAEILRAEFNMILWYQRHGQLIQAATLAREWLIDAVTVRLGQPLDCKQTPRQKIEWAVSGQGMIGRKKYFADSQERREFTSADLNVYGREIYDHWPEQATLGKIWNTLSNVRNQLDHAEHQESRMMVDKIESQINAALKDLAELVKNWGIMASATENEVEGAIP